MLNYTNKEVKLLSQKELFKYFDDIIDTVLKLNQELQTKTRWKDDLKQEALIKLWKAVENLRDNNYNSFNFLYTVTLYIYRTKIRQFNNIVATNKCFINHMTIQHIDNLQ